MSGTATTPTAVSHSDSHYSGISPYALSILRFEILKMVVPGFPVLEAKTRISTHIFGIPDPKSIIRAHAFFDV